MVNKMNVCMFTNTYLPHVGGVARSVHFFSEDIRALGHRVQVLAPEFDAQPLEEQDVIRLPAIQEFNGSDFAVRIPLPYMVERDIEIFQPEVIHSHHPFLLGDTALRVARRHNLPLIFTHHTLYEQYTHYVPIDSDRLASFVINLSTLYANFCDGVIAPSHSLAELIASRGVERPIEVIPTGVDVGFFTSGVGQRFRRSHGISSDALVIGHLGRLAPEKNLDFLADAVIHFMQRHEDAFFLVIGDGPHQEVLHQRFESESLGDRIYLPGSKTGEALADAYAAMDVFAFASLSETQGMVLAEAMAAGIPVVALDATGVRDIVEDDRNGRLLPASTSPEDFSEALHCGVTQADRMSRWREAAQKTARQQSREVCAGRMMDVYARCLEQRQREAQSIPEPMALETVVESIKTEWDLLSTKIKSVVGSNNHES